MCNENRIKYYQDILDHVEPELLKQCSKIIFPKSEAKYENDLTVIFEQLTLYQIEILNSSEKISSGGTVSKALLRIKNLRYKEAILHL